jgi:SAM-dependent methyltransferase
MACQRNRLSAATIDWKPKKSMNRLLQFTVALFLASAPAGLHATDLRLSGLFDDHMTLKRGLVVHLGCGDAALVETLARSGWHAVQGLTPSREQAKTGRERLMAAGVLGNGSVTYLSSPMLPYADRLVNVLVVGDPCGVPVREMLRVLVPGGRLFILAASSAKLVVHVENEELIEDDDARDGWRIYRRAWPKTIDDWPQYLHGADGNCVAQDIETGVPRALRWQAGPLHSQHHNRSNSMTAMVTAGGRIFCMLDDAPPGTTGMPARWSLYARDAFNGILLWKKPLENWGWKAGPEARRFKEKAEDDSRSRFIFRARWWSTRIACL